MDRDNGILVRNARGKPHGFSGIVRDAPVRDWERKISDAILLAKSGFHCQPEIINLLTLKEANHKVYAGTPPMRDLILQPVARTRARHNSQFEDAGGIYPIKFR